ncbi:hypothetical protein Tco_1491751 [Tanacetum coccineum]
MADDPPMLGNNRAVAPTPGALSLRLTLETTLPKTVAFAKGSDDSKLMEKMEALTTKIDSQFKDIKGEIKEMREDATVMEDHTHPRRVMTNPWEDLKKKKPTMPTEDIEGEDIKETTTVGVSETSVTVNQEKTTLPIHQQLKRNSMSLTLRKPC